MVSASRAAGPLLLLALLFAPKSGEELRNDIADATRKGIDKSREAAQQIGTKANERIVVRVVGGLLRRVYSLRPGWCLSSNPWPAEEASLNTVPNPSIERTAKGLRPLPAAHVER